MIERVLRVTSIRNHQLLGTSFPRLLNSLAGRIPLPSTDDLLLELNWTEVVLSHHAEQLNAFFDLLAEFEMAMLFDQYEHARSIRATDIQRLGHSWWTVESDFLLAQRAAGLEGNRELLRTYRDKTNRDWIKIVAQFYSTRVEDGLSAQDYDRECDLLRTTDDDDLTTRRLRAYLRLRVNYHRYDDLSHIVTILNIEESHSIIDRFFTFLRVIRLLLARGDSETRKGMQNVVVQAANSIHFPTLDILTGLSQPHQLSATPLAFELFPILHDYTEGRYSCAAKAASRAIVRFPNCFELYELAAKLRLRGGCMPDLPFADNCLAHELLSEIYSVLVRSSDSPRSLLRLYKLSYQLDSLPFGDQVFSFAHRHDDGLLKRSAPFTDYPGSIATPRLSTTIRNHEDALTYLTCLDRLHPANSAVRLFIATRNALSTSSELAFDGDIPPSRLWKHKAARSRGSRPFRGCSGRLSDAR